MSLQGSVKFFNAQKGFGFISPADGSEDVFVPQSAINSQGFRSLNEGETVTYDAVWNAQKGKMAASNVTGNGDGVQSYGKGGGKGKDSYGNGGGGWY
jgi:CspA family cold shock protein